MRPQSIRSLAARAAFQLALGGAALATFAPATAFAQQPAANEVVPPKLTKDSPAVYPEQALREKVAGRVVVNLI
ncbi:MAG: hypothetical protein KF837_36215, partial [Labilithrix sp.]|nr:hypothetical protein [Labilithrix sp.]